MDRKEKASDFKPSGFAKEREVSQSDARVLPGGTGRENNRGAEPGTLAAEDIERPVGGEPRSAVTGRHDSGTGAN